MAETNKSGTVLLTIVGILWAGLGIVCFGLAFFFLAFYDSPVNPAAGMGLQDYAIIGTVLAFPIFCIIASVGIFILKNRNKTLAGLIALIPLIPLSYIAVMFTRSTSSFMKDTGTAVQASECASPIPDVNDGRETTRCGSIQLATTVSGAFSDVSEAHHWQFTAESQTSISIENDGKSCPHIVILDLDGTIVEGFEDENRLRLCPSGMTTTGFFQFNPPAPGTYIMRVFSPDAPGSYWLKIE